MPDVTRGEPSLTPPGMRGWGEKGRGVQECVIRGHDGGGDGVQKDVAGSVHTHALLQRAVIALGEGNAHLKETVCAPHRISVRVNGKELPGGSVEGALFAASALRPNNDDIVRVDVDRAPRKKVFDPRADAPRFVKKEGFFLAYRCSKLANASFCAPIADQMRRRVAASRCGEKRCWGLPHELIIQRGVRPRKRQF